MTRQQGATMMMMKVEKVIWYLLLLLLIGNASSSSSSVSSLYRNSNRDIIIPKKTTNHVNQQTSLSSPSSLIFMRGGAAIKNLLSKAPSSSSLSSSSSSSYKEKRIKKKQPSPRQEESTISLRPLLVSSFLMIFALMLTGLSPTPILIDQFGAASATKLLSSIASLGAVLEIILSPIFGSLLDSIGRKSVMVGATLLISVVNMIVAVSFLVSASSSSSSSVVSITLTNAIIVSISKLLTAVLVPTTFIAKSAIVGDILASTPNKMGSFMALSMSLVSVGMIVGITTAGKVLGGSTTMIGSLTQKYNPHGILYGLSSLVALISATVIAVRLPETLIDEKRIPFASTSILKKIKQSPASAARLVIGRGKQIRWLAILLVLQSLPTSMGDIFQGTLILVLFVQYTMQRSLAPL